ncbi:hypothetical protein FS842_002774 [Serendipita sp. 407]|nr:hypothetical protein FS842_002774 [Serendipita sp. 407]
MFLELEPYYILQQKPIVRYRLEGLTGMKEESNVTKVSRLEKLEDERAQLLIALSTAQTTIDGSIPASSISAILRLKEENNRLIDERLKIMRTDSTVRDPSCLLPVEIFVHIIDSAIFDALISGWCTETLLSYTLVSTRWRDILMSIPSLWGYVLLKDIDTPYFQEMLFVTLHLSGSAPLVIWLQPPLENWSETRKQLHPHCHRVTELMIDLGNADHALSASHGGILGTLDELGPFPSLRRLRFTGWISESIRASDILHFIERHPQLKEVAGIRLTEDLLKSDYIQKITSFRSQHEPLSIVPHLVRMKKLSEVTFDNYTLFEAGIADSNEEDVVMSQYPTLLLQWTYYSQRGPPIISLLSRTTATLLTLNLGTDFSGLSRLLQILHEFRKLKLLSLYFDPRPKDIVVVPPSPLRRCSSLHDVRICFHDDFYDTIPPDPVAWGPMFARMVRQFLSHIKYILIFAPGREFIFPWEIIESSQFDSLERLHLTLSEKANKPPEGFQLPAGLKEVYISRMRCDAPEISSTSVTSLAIAAFCSPNTFTYLNHNLWPTITSISVPASAINWSEECFKYLQTITLVHERGNKWDYGTQLCRDLATHVNHMPLLQEIHFSDPPEWDILCILLDRYNFRTGVGSTRISSISFGGDVPLFLQDLIKGLCAGKFIDRPSNFELSWISSMDIIQDRNLPGCMECLKRLLPCQMPWSAGADSVTRDGDPLSDYCLDILMDMPLEDAAADPVEFRLRSLFVPIYPETDDKVLETWEVREEAWQTWKQKVRGNICSRFARHVRIDEGDVVVWSPSHRRRFPLGEV